MQSHWADCAIYGEPANTAGPCDCGGLDLPVNSQHSAVAPAIAMSRSLAALLADRKVASLIEAHQLPTDGFAAPAPATYLPDTHQAVPGPAFADGMDLNQTGESAVFKGETQGRFPGGHG